MKTEKIKAWATIDAKEGKIVALCGTREEAREQKRYAAKNGWKQKIVKLRAEAICR